MIGIVVVSHSAKLAEGVCELAGQVAQGRVALAAAGGTSDPEHPIGTDSFKVLEAIESVYGDDGVVVLMDLGSAVLSAETAVEFLDAERRDRVRLCHAPLVESAVSAATQAAAGATFEEIVQELESAVKPTASIAAGTAQERRVIVSNALGLHARPAAQFVRIARGFQARLTVENTTTGAGPVEAPSINGLLNLVARKGHHLLMRAEGPEAIEVLDALAAFVATGCGDRAAQVRSESPRDPAREGQLTGIAASAGIAAGPVVRLHSEPSAIEARTVDDPASEWQRLLAAVRTAQSETRALYDWAQAHAGEQEAGIFDAQSLFLEDPALIEAASAIIHNEHRDAASAWHEATARFAGKLQEIDDPYLRARATDMVDAGRRVLRLLAPGTHATTAICEPSIVVARDLLPSEVEKLNPAHVLGLCLETGSASAHSAILVRAMAIPAVVGLGPGIASVAEGTTVALDGERGVVWVSPDEDLLRRLDQRRQTWIAGKRSAEQQRRAPATTRDGRRITVFANLNHASETAAALDSGAEGVGVLRTEFLFVDRRTAPTEEEQIAAYRSIAETLGTRTLVIRTLDVGGDKNVPYIDIGKEANPFLGWRGLRLTLGRRDLLRTQMRSILRAGHGYPVEILLPMVSTVSELREAKSILHEVLIDLERDGVPYAKNVPVGAMIETPAAVAVVDQLAREVHRLSIGTNDLVQYVMAADRTNHRVAALANPFQPAVLRMIDQTVSAGKRLRIRVDVCGEMAADPIATSLLIGLGVEEFSVSAPLIAELKRAISNCSAVDAEALARTALTLDSPESVRRLITEAR